MGNKPMRRTIFNGKIHRCVVTQADLDYEGSLTIDADLMKAANIAQYEMVHVWNITRGTRLTTYAIEGESGSGVMCVNGAAAHLNKPGDLIIVATFVEMTDEEAKNHVPHVVRVDERNRIISTAAEVPGPAMPSLKKTNLQKPAA